MGAIVAWIAEHARQLVAWTMIIAAISALVAGIVASGAADTMWQVVDRIASFAAHTVDQTRGVQDGIHALTNGALSQDERGWVRLLYYTLYIEGFGELIDLVVINMRALLISSAAAWGLIWRILSIYFVYSQVRALSRWVSNGDVMASEL